MPSRAVYERDRAYYLAYAKAYHAAHRKPRPTLEERLMTRRDVVTPALAAAVFARDGDQCIAPRLGGSEMDCFGRNRIEHVKAEPRMGKRAEPRLDRLVTLCEGHTEAGMRGGYVWCTAKENRAAMREYLRGVAV